MRESEPLKRERIGLELKMNLAYEFDHNVGIAHAVVLKARDMGNGGLSKNAYQ